MVDYAKVNGGVLRNSCKVNGGVLQGKCGE
jgi:hypothetical protein